MITSESIALVTGVSHSQGIGAASCLELAKKGSTIFFTHWEAEDKWVETFQQELIDKHDIRCSNMAIDLSKSTSAVDILNRVTDELGLPTILVNNAAHPTRDGYKKLDAKTLDDHYVVNMRATFLLSVEFAKRFEQEGKSMGRIINLTSGQALGPMTDELAYAATKGAISAFTLSLSAEVAPLGITVNAVNPGPTDTGWMTEEVKEDLTKQFLSGRMGMPKDAARIVSFLASEEAEWITGQVIHSEGGFLRS